LDSPLKVETRVQTPLGLPGQPQVKARSVRSEQSRLVLVPHLARSGPPHVMESTGGACPNSVGRRKCELAIQLPKAPRSFIGSVRTIPLGIEASWHLRSSIGKENREWFELAADNVRPFRQRKFM
jgi:hypothetical protein